MTPPDSTSPPPPVHADAPAAPANRADSAAPANRPSDPLPTGAAPARKKHWLGVLIKLAVSVTLMTWLFWQLSHPGEGGAGGISPLAALRPLWAHWELSLAAAAVLMLSPLWTGLRWHLLLRAEGFDFHWWTTLHLTSVGYLFDAVGIGATGGDAVKGYAIYKHAAPGRRTDGVMTVLVDRIVGLISMAIMSTAGCTWLVLAGETNFRRLGALMSIFTIALIIGFAVPFMRVFEFIPRRLENLGGVGRFPARVFRALSHYRRHRGALFASFIYSLLNQLGLVVSAWLIYLAYAKAFHGFADPLAWLHSGPEGSLQGVELWSLLPTGFMAGMVGLFGGFGPGEFGLAAAFQWTYTGAHAFEVGTMLMLGFHAVQVVSRVVGLPFYLFKPVTSQEIEIDETPTALPSAETTSQAGV
ncbi:MAG: lysylphosphatidylglycerol synthase transmembrane domain-containing protein [Planctomycetota bacterium]